jgi:predicted N-acetyltransferase YhbS
MSSINITLRPGSPADAETCGRICHDAFAAISDQHNFPRDFPSVEAAVGFLTMVLPRTDVYSVVAEVDGKIAGSNFLWEMGPVAGVGPITVDPSVQNSTVGRRLMDDVLRRAQEKQFAGVRLLQAAYHNRSLALYTKLGFDSREPVSLIQGKPLGVKVPGRAVRPASEQDLDECNRLCVRIHGHDRPGETLEAVQQGVATVVENGDRITGYACGVGFFGHSVGESNEDLKALIGAASEFSGPGFLLPTRNGDLLRWCLGQGLRVIMPLTLMSKGLYNEPQGAFLPSVVF